MTAFIVSVHVLVCLALVGIVLLQHGKGADIGSTFGGGASQTVFGSRGAGNFLTKLTTGFAIIFMMTSLTLSYFSAPTSLLEEVEEPLVEEPIPVPEAESSFPEASPLGSESPEAEVPAGFEELPPPESPEAEQ